MPSETSEVEQRIEEIRGRLAVATPGPWARGDDADGRLWTGVDSVVCPNSEGRLTGFPQRVLLHLNASFPHAEDAAFIANARADVPWLLEQLDKAPSQIAAAVMAEREACAALCEGWPDYAALEISNAIRARGQS